MKIAISGKGGAGKTTLSAALAGALASRNRKVVALDADPDSNLAMALGLPPETEIVPLTEMRELIRQRTGAKDGYGGYFKLNPKVDDIPERYAWRSGNIHLLALGGVSKGGDGCICPATALLKALLAHLILGRDDALVMDMEAGIEHLGRATAQSMDALIVVVDPTPWTIQTARRVRKLAGDLHMKKVFAVANRTSPGELEQVRGELDGVPLLGRLPDDDRFRSGVLRVTGEGRVEPGEALQGNLDAVEGILAELQRRM